MHPFTLAALVAGLLAAGLIGWVLDFERRRRRALREFAAARGADVTGGDVPDVQNALRTLFDDGPYPGHCAAIDETRSVYAVDLHAEIGRRASEAGLLARTEIDGEGRLRTRLPDDSPSDAGGDAPERQPLLRTEGDALPDDVHPRLADWARHRDWMVEWRWADGWLLVRRLDRTLHDPDEWETLYEALELASSHPLT